MSETGCRWGFLSTAGIARKNWKAIRLSGNGRVVAVASRATERARAFIEECQAEVPMGGEVDAVGYEELLARDDIDAVYIPLPTGLRKEWVLKAAKAGKHVLCEKPVAAHAEDAAEMIEACRAGGVQFMDGVMFDHSSRLEGIRRSLDDERFGRLRRIQTHFSFASDEDFRASNIRAQRQLEPHGCLGDLGWYCIRFTLWATGWRMPERVAARTLTAIEGGDSDGIVPGEFSAELFFADGISAGFYCSFLTSNCQTAALSGDGGYVTVDDFVLPFVTAELNWTENYHALEIDNCRWNFGRHARCHGVHEYGSGEANAQEVNMVRRMGEIVASGTFDDHYPKIAMKTQRVLDACRRSDIEGGVPITL